MTLFEFKIFMYAHLFFYFSLEPLFVFLKSIFLFMLYMYNKTYTYVMIQILCQKFRTV